MTEDSSQLPKEYVAWQALAPCPIGWLPTRFISATSTVFTPTNGLEASITIRLP